MPSSQERSRRRSSQVREGGRCEELASEPDDHGNQRARHDAQGDRSWIHGGPQKDVLGAIPPLYLHIYAGSAPMVNGFKCGAAVGLGEQWVYGAHVGLDGIVRYRFE